MTCTTGVDQRQVGERLREVAQVPSGARLDLLGVQMQRAGERQQPLAQVLGPVDLADLDQRRHQPERADGEGALLAGQPVVGLLDAVAQHQPVLGELVGDGQHRRAHPRVVGGQEPGQHRQQRASVQRVVAVALGQHPRESTPLARMSALISSAIARHCWA